ncbi:hypothetical protein [Microbacterium sp. No. 7]|uniref:hypothetical protein n=1 Tax=Microbacterium sp. No. 7 TaxID=1714373 RepID=UPI0012E32D0F|nr:hypothetical protein [Microbacterium sp. No. 7]
MLDDIEVDERQRKPRVHEGEAQSRLLPRSRACAHARQRVAEPRGTPATTREERAAQVLDARQRRRIGMVQGLAHDGIRGSDQIVRIGQHGAEHRPRRRRACQPVAELRMLDDVRHAGLHAVRDDAPPFGIAARTEHAGVDRCRRRSNSGRFRRSKSERLRAV